MDTQWYTSIAGIVAGTLIVVEILKRLIGNIAVLKAVPTWVYSVAVAGGLTAASRAAGYLADQGSTLDTLSAAVMMAASASGFWTWLNQPKDAIEDSTQIGPAKKLPIVLLAVALGAGATACAPRNIGPELVRAQDAIHDSMQEAFEGVEAICAPGVLPGTCQAVNKAMGDALRAGRAFSAAVYSERLEGLGPFVAHVGAAISDIQKLPPSELRELVLADLRRAIDAAFRGVQKS